MGYLFTDIPFPSGSRMTGVWNGPWVDDPTDEQVAAISLIALPPGQHVDVENRFLEAHLPFAGGGFGGVFPNGESFLAIFQQCPATASSRGADPFSLMSDAMRHALTYNPGAEVRVSLGWVRGAIVEVYADAGVDPDLLVEWPLADLLAGLLAECCSVPLADVVAGYALDCAFPGVEHECQVDVFTDVFARWAVRQLTPSDSEAQQWDGAGDFDSQVSGLEYDEDEQDDEYGVEELLAMSADEISALAVEVGFSEEEIETLTVAAVTAAIRSLYEGPDEWEDEEEAPDEPLRIDDTVLLRMFPVTGPITSVSGGRGITYAHENKLAWRRLRECIPKKEYKALKKAVRHAFPDYAAIVPIVKAYRIGPLASER